MHIAEGVLRGLAAVRSPFSEAHSSAFIQWLEPKMKSILSSVKEDESESEISKADVEDVENEKEKENEMDKDNSGAAGEANEKKDEKGKEEETKGSETARGEKRKAREKAESAAKGKKKKRNRMMKEKEKGKEPGAEASSPLSPSVDESSSVANRENQRLLAKSADDVLVLNVMSRLLEKKLSEPDLLKVSLSLSLSLSIFFLCVLGTDLFARQIYNMVVQYVDPSKTLEVQSLISAVKLITKCALHLPDHALDVCDNLSSLFVC